VTGTDGMTGIFHLVLMALFPPLCMGAGVPCPHPPRVPAPGTRWRAADL